MLFGLKLITTVDGGVLLDLENDRLLKLNPIGVLFWRAVASDKAEHQIIEQIGNECGADPGDVQRDLRAFQARISELGLSVRAESSADENDEPTTDVSVPLPNFPWYAGSHERASVGALLTACALAGLFAFDLLLSLSSMKSVCRAVRSWPTRQRSVKDEGLLLRKICLSFERACVWYPRKRERLCLQRSAAATCMLRSAGLPARLVLGAQPMPFAPHAWIELRGSVVNDHKGVSRVYQVLARY